MFLWKTKIKQQNVAILHSAEGLHFRELYMWWLNMAIVGAYRKDYHMRYLSPIASTDPAFPSTMG